MFDLPTAPNIMDYNFVDFEEDFLGVSWSFCYQWCRSWDKVWEWEATIPCYDGVFLLFDNITCNVSSCECSYSSGFGASSFSSSGASVFSYSGEYSFSCSIAFEVSANVKRHMIREIWDPGSALGEKINRMRDGKEAGALASLGERKSIQ